MAMALAFYGLYELLRLFILLVSSLTDVFACKGTIFSYSCVSFLFTKRLQDVDSILRKGTTVRIANDIYRSDRFWCFLFFPSRQTDLVHWSRWLPQLNYASFYKLRLPGGSLQLGTSAPPQVFFFPSTELPRLLASVATLHLLRCQPSTNHGRR